MEARDIREELAGLQRAKTSRIPQATRERVLAYLEQARSQGKTWQEIAADIGLSTSGLQRWWRARVGPSSLRPVSLVAESSSGSIALVSPQGYRIGGPVAGSGEESLDAADVIGSTRALADR